jgi:hypothetical protein
MNETLAATNKLRLLLRVALSLCLSSLLHGSLTHWSSVSPARAQSPASPRRVNVPYFPSVVDGTQWSQAAIFWFGKNEQGVPSRNYADVRVAYSALALHVRVTAVDYYLWYNQNPASADDLTQYDAVAIYLDVAHDRGTMPQTDDYFFLDGARHWPNDNAPQYHRQGQGNGSGWNTAWNGSWTDMEAMQWSCDPGPNSNSCGIDYGWTAVYTIPWTTFGLSGPPPEGTLWGLGVLLYDRDASPPAGYVAPEYWPETFAANSPATWGELHFGRADYRPTPAAPQGTTTIRAASPTDNTVEDAWIGGGGTCSGGHEGGSEINHGDDSDLFVGTETAPTHFPCFNKSYLRFSLDAIPPGKAIISATLTLHHWGNAGDSGQAQPSWVNLFTISDPWQEMSIHWNNAPLAQENVAASWIYPLTSFPGWPGNPYNWDATQAVAEAYAAGRPVSLAIYGSDTAQHSSKYLTSSETGDWNATGRPTLVVVWGQPVAALSKQVWPMDVTNEDVVTYTLSWLGTGQALTMTDTLPNGLSNPGAIIASSGNANYNPGVRQVVWIGTPSAGQAVTVTFLATVQISGPLFLHNTAALIADSGVASSDTATILIDGRRVYLPLVMEAHSP